MKLNKLSIEKIRKQLLQEDQPVTAVENDLLALTRRAKGHHA